MEAPNQNEGSTGAHAHGYKRLYGDARSQHPEDSVNAMPETLATRVHSLENRVSTLERDLLANTKELHANTVLTQKVYTNTVTLVELAQSAAVLIRVGKKCAIFLKYAGFAAGGVGAIFALGKAVGIW